MVLLTDDDFEQLDRRVEDEQGMHACLDCGHPTDEAIACEGCAERYWAARARIEARR